MAGRQQDVWGTTDSTGVGHQQLNRGRDESMVDKVKDKMPGSHTGSTDTAGYGTGQQQTGYGHEQKGMMEKIKEKVPGSHTSDTGYGTGHQQTTGGFGSGQQTTAGGYGSGQQTTAGGYGHEDRGMVDKIKEKIPGSHTSDTGYGTGHQQTTGGFGSGQQTTTGGYGSGQTAGGLGVGREHEGKKGMMEKITEKLPGAGAGTGTGTGQHRR